jgi:hypothetical protein
MCKPAHVLSCPCANCTRSTKLHRPVGISLDFAVKPEAQNEKDAVRYDAGGQFCNATPYRGNLRAEQRGTRRRIRRNYWRSRWRSTGRGDRSHGRGDRGSQPTPSLEQLLLAPWRVLVPLVQRPISPRSASLLLTRDGGSAAASTIVASFQTSLNWAITCRLRAACQVMTSRVPRPPSRVWRY